MRLLILSLHPIESPGPRFRIYQYLPYFKQAGIEYTISAFLNSEEYMNIYNGPATSFLEKSNAAIKGIARQIHAIADIKSYDGVIVYREAILVGRPWIERYIVKKGIPIIFDFDDAIWMPVKSQTGISPILKRLIKSTKKFDEIMQLSTHIVAGNNYLAQHAQLLNKHVSVIPTVVDTDYYKPSTAKQNRDDIVIGWIGSGSTSVYLKLLDNIWSKLQFPSLPKRDNADASSPSLFKEGGVPERSLGRELKIRSNALSPSLSKRDAADEPQHNLVLKIIGGTYNPIGIHTNNIKWSLDTELAEMSEFDIGIMPLPDDEWAKGKCGLKILQYMAMGIPCVASPVGVNTEIIQDGVNGFLAKDEKEWIEKLTLLIENPELRQRLGRAGRKTVEERYSLKVWAPRYVEIIKKVVELRS